MKPNLSVIFIVVVSLLVACRPAVAQESEELISVLSAAERAAGMAAVERVRFAHRVEGAASFDKAYPLRLWQERAVAVVRMSNRLADCYGLGVDDALLERELQRMVSSTASPGRLDELFAALGHDRLLVKECLVRPLLVQRLLAERAGVEDRFSKQRARLRWPSSEHPVALLHGLQAKGRGVRVPPVPTRCAPGTGCRRHLPAPSWWVSVCPPTPRSGHVMVWTGTEAIIWGGRSDDRRPYLYDPQLARWRVGSSVDAPTARSGATAVWTGEEMIVWGGSDDFGKSIHGSRYNPETDTWHALTGYGAPGPRIEHTVVWTGTEMIVWGGRRDDLFFGDGAAYDPHTDTWRDLPPFDFLWQRSEHTAVWTGTEMIIWGGTDGQNLFDTGAAYDPHSDTWRAVSGFDSPMARAGHRAVWTGSEMVIAGGVEAGPHYAFSYDVAGDRWTRLASPPELAPIKGLGAVTSGSKVIIWGGTRFGYLVDPRVHMYDLQSGTWATPYMEQQPAMRSDHTAVWTGDAMLVWGGTADDLPLVSGGEFDPVTSSWTPVSDCGTPYPVDDAAVVWTGAELVVWAGEDLVHASRSGRYDPATDCWLPISMVNAPEEDGAAPIAAWTGTEVIIWGQGFWGVMGGLAKPEGGRYDPVTDTWSRISVDGAPLPRDDAAVVWTGSELVVWSEPSDSVSVYSAIYDPATDLWRRMSQNTTLDDRRGESVVWTGTEMIIWGGYGFMNEYHRSGARYDPATDSWRPMALRDAPGERMEHTAVWTGEEMIIWGGHRVSDLGRHVDLDDGARYDPVANRWSELESDDAPAARSLHTAVWTGSQMLIWGGAQAGGDGVIFGDGAVFDAADDQWLPLLATGQPDPRFAHSAVWTGEVMLIWGGAGGHGLAAYVHDSE